MIGFGVLQIYYTAKTKPEFDEVPRNRSIAASSFVLGLAFDPDLNPYFILWWLTIGSVLIVQALAFKNTSSDSTGATSWTAFARAYDLTAVTM